MATKVLDTGSKSDWSAFEKIFGSSDGYESEFALPRRWDGKDIYIDLDDLLKDYLKKVTEFIPELKEKTENVCGRVRDMLRLYLHGYPSDAYAVMRRLMEELDENPLYVDVWKIKNLYRMSSVPENIDDKPRIFHAPYNIRPKIRTYRYSIAGYPSLYLAESLRLAEEEMHLFRDKKPAIAARFKFDEDFTKRNLTKILEFGFRPQDLASDPEEKLDNNDSRKAERNEEKELSEKENLRRAFIKSVEKADEIAKKIKKEHARKTVMQNGNEPEIKTAFKAQDRYMVWYPLIAACSYVRTNREDPFAPEYIVPQLLTQWMRSESTGELVGIRYFSCYSRHASEVGCNYVFPTSGDPIILRDGVRPYCPVLNEAFAFTGTEYLPEYTGGVEELQTALDKKIAKRVFHLTREDFKDETKVELPVQLIYIAARSFWGCEKLKTVKNMDYVVSIGDSAFSRCESLNLFKLPVRLTSIGNYAFYACSSLALEELPEGLTSMGDFAFSGCTNLKLTKLPEGLTDIGGCAFRGCTNLKLTKLPVGLSSIGKYAFSSCTSLSLSELPEGLTSIGDFAFYGCEDLKLSKLPEGLTSIGVEVFSGCKSLAITELPEGLTGIGDMAFCGCKSLALTKLPNGLNRIEWRTFSDCTSLALTMLPDGIEHIRGYAFEQCQSITEIVFPNSLIELGYAVFDGCSKLKNIRYSGSKEQWLKIHLNEIWDAGTPDYTFRFADGTVMTKKELHAFEGRPDPVEESVEEEVGA